MGYIDLYFLDESHFNLVPYVPYAWQLKGEEILLPSERGRSISVIGALSRDNNLIFDMVYGTINSDYIIDYINKIADKIKCRTVLVLDNAPIHRSKKFKAKIKEWEKMDLILFFLSPYSPELNIIEILWKRIKYKWLPFESYKDNESLHSNLKYVLQNYGKEYVIKYQ